VLRAHIEREKILSEQVSFQMVTMLQDVVARGTGAAVRSQGIRGPVGGKTGTTSENRDAWFVGFNSSVVVGIWVGFDQPQKIFEGASGSRVALPIWADFMRRTARRLPSAAFEAPDQLRRENICLLSYRRALDGCPTYVEYFKEGDDVPSQLCPIHQGSLQQRAERAVQGLVGAIGRSIRGIFR
jgi:penicillin-binding protein 1A